METNQPTQYKSETQVVTVKQTEENRWEAVHLVGGRLNRVYVADSLKAVLEHAYKDLLASSFPIGTMLLFHTEIERPEGA